MLGATPHGVQNTTNRASAIDGRTTRHPGFAVVRWRDDLPSRKTVNVGTGAADQSPLHADGAVPRFGHVPRQVLAALAAAEDEDVNMFRSRRW